MKTKVRIMVAGLVVLVLVLGAWNAVFAEKGSNTSGPGAALSNLLSPLFQRGSSSPEVETEVHNSAETPQVMEDNPLRQSDDSVPQAAGAPEAGDDSLTQHESMDTPQANGEVRGRVTALDAATVTIDGKVYNLSGNVDGLSGLKVGDAVKLEFVVNADGTVSVREIKIGDNSGGSDDSGQSGSDDSSGSPSSGSGSGGSDDGGSGGGGGGGGSGSGGGSDG